jgi:hypothetical protein
MKSAGISLRDACEQMIAHAQSEGKIDPSLTIASLKWRMTPDGKEVDITLSNGDTVYIVTKEPKEKGLPH